MTMTMVPLVPHPRPVTKQFNISWQPHKQLMVVHLQEATASPRSRLQGAFRYVRSEDCTLQVGEFDIVKTTGPTGP